VFWGGLQATRIAWASPPAQGGPGGLTTACDRRSFGRNIPSSFRGVQALGSCGLTRRYNWGRDFGFRV